MTDLYYWPTPNGDKIFTMLEECDLDYIIKPANVTAGDQFRPDFLRLSSDKRAPAIVDNDSIGGGPATDKFFSVLSYCASQRKPVIFAGRLARTLVCHEVAHVAD